ncbi:MAG: nucleotidyltransferase family protein [Muribaculaceae bacterium]|nr:nucleotidyltransferase family protein [Muribaculaceae bacterium]
MFSLESIISTLQTYFQDKPISRAWIFGSYARGDQTPSSDIDILVSYDDGFRPGLLGIVKIIQELEETLNLKVDLVEEGTLYPYIANEVEAQKIKIYERINP